jgi:hypothetical protein
VAHIALTNDATLGIKLRNGIRTVPHTILTANAGLRRVQNNACMGILFVGIHGTAAETVCRKAMIAPHGKVVARSIRPRSSLNLSNTPPAQIGRIAVLLVACDLAGAAADAFGHIEMKAILLSRRELSRGNERVHYLDGRLLPHHFKAVLRQTHNGTGSIGVREFMERKRHRCNSFPDRNFRFG